MDRSQLDGALASLSEMLGADGYELETRELTDRLAHFKINAGPQACADCLVPKSMMTLYFQSALRPAYGEQMPEIQLTYPSDED